MTEHFIYSVINYAVSSPVTTPCKLYMHPNANLPMHLKSTEICPAFKEHPARVTYFNLLWQGAKLKV